MITCLFSCPSCGITDVEVQVAARESPNEDIAGWVSRKVLPAVRLRHASLSLLCESAKMKDLKIPFDDADADGWIGKQTSIVPPQGPTPQGPTERVEGGSP